MNILLWILQILIGLHTFIGGAWKFSHTSEQTMASLSIISNQIWLGLGFAEIICALILILPLFINFLKRLVPLAAALIAIEMIIFSFIHLTSVSATDYSPVYYWAIVSGICILISFGRLKLSVLRN